MTGSFVLVQMTVLFFVTITMFLSNVAVQLLLQSFYTDTKECLARPGSMNPLDASGLSCLTYNMHCVFVFNLAPLGSATDMFLASNIV